MQSDVHNPFFKGYGDDPYSFGGWSEMGFLGAFSDVCPEHKVLTGGLGYAEIPEGMTREYNPMFAVDPWDWDYVELHGEPYVGMAAIDLETDAWYSYEGFGYWQFGSWLSDAVDWVKDKVKSAYNAGKDMISKIGSFVKKYGSKIGSFIGKYGAMMAPIVAFIPAIGPVLASGLVAASVAYKLYQKYKSVPGMAEKAIKAAASLAKKKGKKAPEPKAYKALAKETKIAAKKLRADPTWKKNNRIRLKKLALIRKWMRKRRKQANVMLDRMLRKMKGKKMTKKRLAYLVRQGNYVLKAAKRDKKPNYKQIKGQMMATIKLLKQKPSRARDAYAKVEIIKVLNLAYPKPA